MRASTVVMIAVAVVFGVLSVIVAQTWLNRQAELRMKNLEAQKPVLSTRTVVVARTPLRFGAAITPQVLREVAWPDEAIPAGAFSSIQELTSGERRVVLTSIEPNEPVIGTKITGPGQRGTLSAIIDDGMKAVTVRVNEIDGVAGFVLPGDRVDVLVTRTTDGGSEGGKGNQSNDVVLQNVKVLGVDQSADENIERPMVVKAVTLEVDTVAAQKLTLASAIGNLSLVLRKAGDATEENSRRVTVTDIGANRGSNGTRGSHATVVVIRPDNKQEFSVPVERTGPLQAGGASAMPARP